MSTWDILILTQPCRAPWLKRLRRVLDPQVAQHKDVQVHVRMFDPSLPFGENSQGLIDQVSGTYANFLDDDDMIVGDYIETILPLLDGAVDCVSYQMRWTCDSRLQKPIHVSLKYPDVVRGDASGVYFHLSHLCPMKLSLMRQVQWSGDVRADGRWREEMRKLNVVRTEHHIARELYWVDQISGARRPTYFRADAVAPAVKF